MGPCSSCTLVCTLDVDGIDQIPIRIFHILEADVSQDASVIEEDVDSAKGIDGGLNDSVAILDTVVVGYGLAAGLLDLFYDDIRRLLEVNFLPEACDM